MKYITSLLIFLYLFWVQSSTYSMEREFKEYTIQTKDDKVYFVYQNFVYSSSILKAQIDGDPTITDLSLPDITKSDLELIINLFNSKSQSLFDSMPANELIKLSNNLYDIGVNSLWDKAINTLAQMVLVRPELYNNVRDDLCKPLLEKLETLTGVLNLSEEEQVENLKYDSYSIAVKNYIEVSKDFVCSCITLKNMQKARSDTDDIPLNVIPLDYEYITAEQINDTVELFNRYKLKDLKERSEKISEFVKSLPEARLCGLINAASYLDIGPLFKLLVDKLINKLIDTEALNSFEANPSAFANLYASLVSDIQAQIGYKLLSTREPILGLIILCKKNVAAETKFDGAFFSPDGKFFAAKTYSYKTGCSIQIYKTETGELVRRVDSGPGEGLLLSPKLFSPNGNYFISANSSRTKQAWTIRVLNVITGKNLYTTVDKNHPGRFCWSFSPCSTYLVLSLNKEIIILNMETEEVNRVVYFSKNDNLEFGRIKYSPDGCKLAYVIYDLTHIKSSINILDAKSLKTIESLEPTDGINTNKVLLWKRNLLKELIVEYVEPYDSQMTSNYSPDGKYTLFSLFHNLSIKNSTTDQTLKSYNFPICSIIQSANDKYLLVVTEKDVTVLSLPYYDNDLMRYIEHKLDIPKALLTLLILKNKSTALSSAYLADLYSRLDKKLQYALEHSL
jgi:hypothetical protein